MQARKESSDRFGMRFSIELKQKLARAAQLKGVSPAQFVKTILTDAADKIINEHKIQEISRRDREAFAKTLEGCKEVRP